MRCVDINGKVLSKSEIDLTKGEILEGFSILKEGVIPPDGVNKIAYISEDYEIGCLYVLKPVKDNTPTQLDVLEAQVTYTAMMTDTLLEG